MATLPHPKKSKRTQFTPRLSSRASGCGAKHSGAKSRDLPNHHRRRRFQTNKSRPYPKYAKRTQFSYRWRLAGFPAPNYAKRTQFTPRLSSRASGCEAQRPKVEGSAKSPSPQAIPNKQITPVPQLCETNPIPAKSELPTLAEGQSRLVGEPNPSQIRASHAGRRSVKVYPGAPGTCRGTQFQPVSSSPRWPKGRQSLSRRAGDAHRKTQFAPTATQPTPKIRNEPNLPHHLQATIYKPPLAIHNTQYTIPRPNSQMPKQRLTLYV